ncbi:MAG: phosphopantothenoylcysteine decarboxylase [Candidatus Omnitrophota bacterium]
MAIKLSQKLKVKSQKLKNKRILITAGPTWVPIDEVRVISNIATAKTGIIIAEEAKKQGAQVRLFLGPAGLDYSNKSIRIRRFKYFSELKDIISKELSKKLYDIIIHSAAVSDFSTVKFKGKLESSRDYNLKLKRLPKIIKIMRRLAPDAKLVMFKLESGLSDALLISKAELAQHKINADYVVANRTNPYRAFIISKKGNSIVASSKVELAKKLLKSLSYNL